MNRRHMEFTDSLRRPAEGGKMALLEELVDAARECDATLYHEVG